MLNGAAHFIQHLAIHAVCVTDRSGGARHLVPRIFVDRAKLHPWPVEELFVLRPSQALVDLASDQAHGDAAACLHGVFDRLDGIVIKFLRQADFGHHSRFLRTCINLVIHFYFLVERYRLLVSVVARRDVVELARLLVLLLLVGWGDLHAIIHCLAAFTI